MAQLCSYQLPSRHLILLWHLPMALLLDCCTPSHCIHLSPIVSVWSIQASLFALYCPWNDHTEYLECAQGNQILVPNQLTTHHLCIQDTTQHPQIQENHHFNLDDKQCYDVLHLWNIQSTWIHHHHEDIEEIQACLHLFCYALSFNTTSISSTPS